MNMGKMNYNRPQFRKSGGNVADGVKYGDAKQPTKQQKEYAGHKFMAAQNDGICKHCNKEFKVGNTIAWFPHNKVAMHRKCV